MNKNFVVLSGDVITVPLYFAFVHTKKEAEYYASYATTKYVDADEYLRDTEKVIAQLQQSVNFVKEHYVQP